MVTTTRILAIAALSAALVLSLTACTPPSSLADSSTPAADQASATPTVSASAAPDVVDAASYLLAGTPGVFDANGEWSGHYGFFTDDTKSVRCDIFIYSGDSGGVDCAITPGNEAKRTYTVPSTVDTTCSPSSEIPSDGYSVDITFKALGPSTSAGFIGCRSNVEKNPDIIAATKVLHDNQTLKVESGPYKYKCTVAAGVASCAEAHSGASITFGLSVAEYAG
jgi:hypothetical protein